MPKIELKKALKSLYSAAAEPSLVEVPRMSFLMIEKLHAFIRQPVLKA